MFLKVGVIVALAACALGLAYKIRLWLTVAIGPEAVGISAGQRAAAALGGLGRAIFSRRLGAMLKALALDGLWQRRVWNHSRLAWLTHICIFVGFLGLLLLHALGDVLTKHVFSGYQPTVHPYLFLRNLCGTLVLVGVGLAIYRRCTLPGLKLTTRGLDRLALVLLAVIIFSGFALEGVKIVSHQSFERMVKEYPPAGGEPAEVAALEAYWAREFGVAFPAGRGQGDARALELGRRLHEETCADCHAPAQWAFLAYGLGKALGPAGVSLAGAGEEALWYLHVLASLLGLAILPFSKFLHLFTTPLLLAVRAGMDRRQLSPANLATLRAYELDACMHCSVCSVHCSVGVAYPEVGNQNILPGEKLAALMRLSGARPGQPSPRELRLIRQGAYICTSCLRCTNLCTAGINLQDLWLAMKADLARQGLGSTYHDVRQALGRAAQPSRQAPVVRLGNGQPAIHKELKASALAGNFSSCYKCITCSNSCPVVRMYERPLEELDLMPHQIMHCLGLGLKEEAMGARMTWNCLTCYHCQEACPQGVRVADILYELRHLASAQSADLEV
ncbi:MAG: 4Fe-4S dicluster domain-containing protein [Desulfarculus sp.]|nr:4Fe-4S dicluster domain-containing protein [Desulfarculus sp.]